MKLLFTRHISTLIGLSIRAFLSSLEPATSWECPQCGSRVNVQSEGGTWLLDFASDLRLPNSSHSRHVVALTAEGKLSILCASEPSGKTASPHSGASAGISSLSTSHVNLLIIALKRIDRERQIRGVATDEAFFDMENAAREIAADAKKPINRVTICRDTPSGVLITPTTIDAHANCEKHGPVDTIRVECARCSPPIDHGRRER